MAVRVVIESANLQFISNRSVNSAVPPGSPPQNSRHDISLSSVRRLGIRVVPEITVKPIKLPIQAFHQMFWFSSARNVVIFAGNKTSSHGTPKCCRARNHCSPWSSGTRKSMSEFMISTGV